MSLTGPSSAPTAFRIEPLAAADVRAAAALIVARTERLRMRVPALPSAWADPVLLETALAALAAKGDALAAIGPEGLVGFQGAIHLDGHGGRWAYSADIAHGATGREARAVIEALYARLAERWVRDACIEHVVTVLADDAVALETFGQLGFGATVVDLVRDLAPVPQSAASEFTVRRAGPADTNAIGRLDEGLRRHLSASPVFLVLGAPTSPELQRRRLADPDVATFIAEVDGAALAFLRIGPCATDVATIVRDSGTASVTGAFTVADRRGEGVASALLDAALAWARTSGYARCGVDHESANVDAARFWRRHFTPVAYSLTRRLASRLAR
jgi:GNAT superfamily N-acetyltransferase